MAARIYYLVRSKQEPPPYIAVTLFSLIGVFGVVFGGECLYDIKTATTVQAVGVIDHVVLSHGRTDHYWFTFRTASGAYRLSSDYGGPGLQNNETVEISFLDKPSTLTYLRVLDPPQNNWLVLHEGNGMPSAIALCVFGFGAFVVVFVLCRRRTLNRVSPAV